MIHSTVKKEYVRSGYKAVAEIISQVDDAEEKLWEAFERKKPAIDTVLKDEGIYSEELKERCLEVYRNHKPDIHLYFGVADMLKGIRKRGMNIGIITDGRPEDSRGRYMSLAWMHWWMRSSSQMNWEAQSTETLW